MLRHATSGAYFLSNSYVKRHKIYLLCGVSHLTLLVALPLGIFPVYPPGGYTGKIPIAGIHTIYFPGGAFDLRGYYGTICRPLLTVDTPPKNGDN